MQLECVFMLSMAGLHLGFLQLWLRVLKEMAQMGFSQKVSQSPLDIILYNRSAIA